MRHLFFLLLFLAFQSQARTAPDPVVVQLDSLHAVTCKAGSVGSIFITVTAGVAPFTFDWDNGATTEDLQNVSAGSYEVTVTASDGGTAIATFALWPTYPTAVATASSSILCSNPTAIVTSNQGSSVGPSIQYLFSTANGSILSPPDAPEITVGSGGDYSLIVLDTATGCIASADVTVLENLTLPTVDAGADQNVVCANDGSILSGSSTTPNITFLWTASNGGQIISGETSLTPVVASAGTYTLTATDQANGCSASDDMEVTADFLPPAAYSEGGTLNCVTTELNLQVAFDTLNTTFFWSFPNGDISLEESPLIHEAGLYEFFLSDTITGCGSVSYATVDIDTLVPIAAAAGGLISCINSMVQLSGSSTDSTVVFDWIGPNNFGTDEQNPFVSEPGDYILTVIDTINGCSASVSTTVEIDIAPPTASAGPSQTLTCLSPTAVLDGSASSQGPDFSYSWTTTDGHLVSGNYSTSPTVDAPGTYTLTVLNGSNGCTATATVVILENKVLPEVGATGGTLTCVEPTLALQSIFNPNGTTISWAGPNNFSSNQPSPTVSNAGSYVFTVVNNANGCSNSAIAYVFQNQTPPDATAFGGSITCVEDSVTLFVISQTPNVTFAWTTTGGIFSTENEVTVGVAGDYAVIVTDPTNGCTATANAQVLDETMPPVADAGPDAALNCYFNSLVLNGLGSQLLDASYEWTTTDGHIVEFGDTPLPTIDAAGTYVLLVTDLVTGCSARDTVVITQTPAVFASISASQNVSCFDGANGSASVVASGGVGNFIYGWSNGSQTDVATDLIAGEYSVTVFDGEGCPAVASVTISQPEILAPNATATNLTAPLSNDGTASANPTGGTAPYSFLWTNGAMTASISGLAAGAYSVVVTDANGCSATEIVNVEPSTCHLEGFISYQNVHCFGENDGEALVLLTNEAQPVLYSWSNAATTSSIENLTAGQYVVSVIDAAGCTLVLSVEILQPAQFLTVGEVFHNDVLCDDSTDGFIIGYAAGGTQPYEFSWSNGDQSAATSNLGLGVLTLLVIDAQGCASSFGTEIISVDHEPPVLSLKNITVSLDQGGEATVAATDFDNGSLDLDCGIASWTASPSAFDCLQLGTQKVYITATDGNGNTALDSAYVTIVDDVAPVLLCPDNKTVGFCHATQTFGQPIVQDNCVADINNLFQTGGLPSGSIFPIGTTEQVFSFTDGGGNAATCSFEITVVDEPTVSVTVGDETCAGKCNGSISIEISGGLPAFGIDWSNGATGLSIEHLCAGDFAATVTDGDGCETTISETILGGSVTTASVAAFQNPVCSNGSDGSISVVADGVSPFNFVWSNGNLSSTQTNLSSGTYSVTVTDALGCTATTSKTLTPSDNEAPTLVLKDATLPLSLNGSVDISYVPFDDGSFDNCGITGWTVTPLSFDCSQLGNHVVTLTAYDEAGNAKTGQAIVTIIDNITPTLACPASVKTSFCHPTVSFAQPAIVDNCPIDGSQIQLIAGLNSGSVFPIGLTTETFSFTDPAGNSGQCSFTVTVFGEPSVAATATNPSCFGDCNGSMTLTLTNGYAPYSFLWSNGQTTQTATNLCAGLFSATVTDAGGCTKAVGPFTVAQPLALSIVVDQTTNETNGNGQGSIFITPNGGTAPFSYAWTKNGLAFANVQDLTSLSAGSYQVVITDANGCSTTSAVIVISNVVATDEPAWAAALSLQPNPANDWLRLVFDTPIHQNVELSFFDATGRFVKNAIFENVESSVSIEVVDLAAGVWQLQIKTEDGATAIRKVVVTR